MKKYLLLLSLLITSVLTLFFTYTAATKAEKKEPGKTALSDWFVRQRMYPGTTVDYKAHQNAVRQAEVIKKAMPPARAAVWQFAGPINLGGRVTDVEMHTSSQQIIYLGAATGGIFKSTDQGTTWTPVFDQSPSLSIGDIAIAPSDANVLYVGTGEANGGGGSTTYDGMGIFKSVDAGSTWTNAGLDSCRNFGRIVVHPSNSNIVYAASMGELYAKGSQRGVYKSTDGGVTWNNTLFVDDSTGAIDVVIHPTHPDTIFAATWTRVRTPARQNYGGPASNIWRSYNGGTTWTKLAGGLPINASTNGRIGIDICLSTPNVLWAVYADNIGNYKNVFQSSNNGDTWTSKGTSSLSGCFSSYGWWFGRIKAHPTSTSTACVIGFDLYRTTDAGGSWAVIGSSNHVDHHAFYIHPANTQLVLNGNDGGLYKSTNGGTSFTRDTKLPIMQFYTCEIDNSAPSNLYGGSQDNGVNRTLTGALNNWSNVHGGDGFCCLVDPINNAYKYYSSQYGSMSTSMSGISGSDRKNWNTPVAFNPLNSKSLYYGANRLYKSTNRSGSWKVISPDLTNGNGGNGGVVFGTITSISISPIDTNQIWVGTDDGNVRYSSNNGGTWANVSAGLPKRWITRVVADLTSASTAYVSVSGYKWDEFVPHIYRTTNSGATWTSISSNLPNAPVNDLIIDPTNTATLYAATDVGVYVTRDAGTSWQLLANGMPNVIVLDLTLHNPTRTLLAGTFGRSMYKVDLNTVNGVNESSVTSNVVFFPNPFTEQTTLRINENTLKMNPTLLLYTINGKLVRKEKLQNTETIIRKESIESGIYFFEIRGEKKKYDSGKIIVL